MLKLTRLYLFPVPVLAILPYLSHSQVGLDGNIAIHNYRAIEAAYARELTRPTGISTPFDSQITFVQQVKVFILTFYHISLHRKYILRF
jgi:hypothetical protein